MAGRPSKDQLHERAIEIILSEVSAGLSLTEVCQTKVQGITPAQFRALRVLRRHGDLRLSELSDRLQIAARSTTEVIDALESRHLVARRPDPDDRRATLVEVTEHGTGVLEAIRAARGTEAERAFGQLTPADRADLARILRKLRK